MDNEIFKEKIKINETKINLISDIQSHELKKIITEARNSLKKYTDKFPRFTESLKPVKIKLSNEIENIPKIVELMSDASEIANVGPIAAIAGAISEISIEYLIKKGSNYSIVDNGGDIGFISNEKFNKNVICGIYAGNSVLSGKIAFEFKKNKSPLGICSSSGTVGYSISYGRADSVTIIANQPSIADALATSIANKVSGKSDNIAVEKGLIAAEEFKEYFIGGLIIVGDSIGTIGKLPKIILTDKENTNKFIDEE